MKIKAIVLLLVLAAAGLVLWRGIGSESGEHQPATTDQVEPQSQLSVSTNSGDSSAEPPTAEPAIAATDATRQQAPKPAAPEINPRRARNRRGVGGLSESDRQKAISRLADVGFQSWEAEDLRDRWETAMRDVSDRVSEIREANPNRGFNERALLRRGALAELREELSEADYLAARYAAAYSTEINIYAVQNGTAAAQLGLLPGDQIYAYDGYRLFDTHEYRDLRDQEVDRDRPVVLQIRRGGQTFEIEVPGGDVGTPIVGVSTFGR